MSESSDQGTDRSSREVALPVWISGLLRTRTAARSTKTRAILAASSLILFIGGFSIGYANLPPLHSRPNWILIVLVLVLGVPLSLLWNAAEYHLTLVVIGLRSGLRRTIRISVLAAAANLLPLPGSALVRAREMYRISGAGRDVVKATATVGMVFIGTAMGLGGGFLLSLGPRGLGLVILSLGSALIIGAYLLVRTVPNAMATLLVLILVEAASVLTKALRYYIVLRALHYEPEVVEVLALTLMSVLALATGIFPGGIGGSEVLAAAISPFIALGAATAVVTSALDNLVQFVGLAIPTVVVLARGSNPDADADP